MHFSVEERKKLMESMTLEAPYFSVKVVVTVKQLLEDLDELEYARDAADTTALGLQARVTELTCEAAYLKGLAEGGRERAALAPSVDERCPNCGVLPEDAAILKRQQSEELARLRAKEEPRDGGKG